MIFSGKANFINGLIYLISAPASPVLGILIDKSGRNLTYTFLSILVTLFCHVLLGFTFLNPYVAIIIMGISYSLLASALWPIAALIIPEHQLGTAYGNANSEFIYFCSITVSDISSSRIYASHPELGLGTMYNVGRNHCRQFWLHLVDFVLHILVGRCLDLYNCHMDH